MNYTEFTFPVGFKSFHENERLNFQLNRSYSMGLGRYEDIETAASQITDHASFISEMTEIAEQAYAEGRFFNAVGYYRSAEFYTPSTNPSKFALYDRMVDAFDLATQDDDVERFFIPYQDGFLSAIRLAPHDSKGVVVMHGGYDAYIEELYSFAAYMVYKGYAVILFEGPGQGASRHKHNLTFTHEWEKPTSAVLDFFGIDDVTLIGLSLGGYLAARAAAFEPRISRVVAWDHYYDWEEATLSLLPPIGRIWFKLLWALKAKSVLNREPKNGHNPLVIHGQYVTGTDNFYDWWQHMRQYSFPSIAHLVEQEVLVLAGEDDVASPIHLYPKYVKALTSARSVTGRVFTQKEHAAAHNQLGNIQLALDVILVWVGEKSGERKDSRIWQAS